MTQTAITGERYGEFEISRYLAAGGMADLWLARSPRFARQLVLKKIQPRFVQVTRAVKMFIDEGRIAQALEHPNIVKVVGVGQEAGTYFIAMEYIPGRDLLAICRRGIEVGNFLPRHLAVAILAQAARGLVYAHEKRDEAGQPLEVVHCDISPGNVVVGWGGTVKLVDFGIARAAIMLRAEDETIAGKYNYMAPEQIRGEAVDARADLFALGIMLYELTVGKRLFRGRPEQVIKLVLEEPIVPPKALRPDYPEALAKVVMRALERDPERRYQSARELRADLVSWLSSTRRKYGKREISAYLRAIYGARKQHEADEFVGDGSQAEDELLEKGFARLDSEWHIDAEDASEERSLEPPAAPEPVPASPVASPAPSAVASPAPAAAAASESSEAPPVAPLADLPPTAGRRSIWQWLWALFFGRGDR